LHFINYLDGKNRADIDLIIEQAQRLPDVTKQNIYQALLQKPHIEGVKRIPHDVDQTMLIGLVEAGAIPLREAQHAFPTHQVFQITNPIVSSGAEVNVVNECQSLITQLRALQISPKDQLLSDYCDQQSFMLQRYQNDPAQLAEIKKSLSTHLQAVNSKEIIAIKKEIDRLHSMKHSFFGFGPIDENVINKINLIKENLSKVPLLERLHVFSNKESEHCNQVRVALAEHRHWFRSSALTNGKVDPNKTAARSFANLQQQFKDTDSEELPQETPNI
jgi:hypothetical protein